MTTDYRAMCAELVDDLEMSDWPSKLKETFRADITRARALLDQPVAEGLTDEELLRVAATAIAPYKISGITPGEYEPETECCVEAYGSELIAYARAVLDKWGAPTPQPVAASERLPGPDDCDEQGRCWLWERDCGYNGRKWALVDRAWALRQSDEDLSVYTHWLHANALPTPEATND